MQRIHKQHVSHLKEGIIGYYKYMLKSKLLTMKVNLKLLQTNGFKELLVCAKGISLSVLNCLHVYEP